MKYYEMLAKEKGRGIEMEMNVKNIIMLFLFVVISVLVAKWIGEKIPAIGTVTSKM